MKTEIKQTLFILLVFTMLFMGVKSMNSQNNRLLIKGNVTLNNLSTVEKYTVKILDMDNDTIVKEIKASKVFTYELEYGKHYMVIISRDQYQSKSIFFNTECSSNKKFKYTFDCNLEPDEVHDGIVCQAGGVFYKPKVDNFVHYYHR